VSPIAPITVVSLAVVLTVTLPIPSRADSSDDFAANLGTEMPELLELYDVPGTVIAHIADGDVAWTKAYGLADSSRGIPMSPDMLFEFGSCGKVLTAWATMRLVEEGAIELDAPVNRYLKRWQLESTKFEADEVTVRRLLTHTGGLNMHGYLDYSPRRVNPPDLVRSLESMHLLDGLADTVLEGDLSFGNVEVVQEPGTGYRYSGAGFAILQMLIEDVSGESFDGFVQNEITDPLGATSLRWAWTPELAARAPTPYGEENQPLEYRQLTMHGIGSEIGTVTDFARFVAAAVTGPNGEPPGRGVLRPDTVETMITSWPEARSDEGFEQGLGYGLGRLNGALSLSHGGANTGWMALFIIDTARREGFVVASASNRAEPLHSTIFDLWIEATYGPGGRSEWSPVPRIGPLSTLLIVIASLLTLILAFGLFRFSRDLRAGRRKWAGRPNWRSWWRALPWALAWLFGWYTVYSSFPLYLPPWYPDLWPTIGSRVLMLTLTAGFGFSLMRAFFPQEEKTVR